MILLTFDTDYMTDDWMHQFLDEMPLPGRGTFFVWQPSPDVDLGNHEIGPHPFLSETAERPWKETVADFMAAMGRPAVCFRSHSVVYSHMLGISLKDLGFTSVSQATYLFQDGLRPYRHPWGLWELPIYYMDSMDMTYPHNWPTLGHVPLSQDVIKRATEGEATYVFDFHPLHIALNCSSFEQYQSVKHEVVDQGRNPFDLAFPGRGVRDFYLALVQAMSDAGLVSVSCSDAIATESGDPS